MVRFWTDVVQEATNTIREAVRTVASDAVVHVEGGPGADRETVEVTLVRDGRKARCVVTFEAWDPASRDPREMTEAFRQIIESMESPPEQAVYFLTSRGLTRAPLERSSEELRDLAAGQEADAFAEQVLRTSKG
jgi:hypothetical protein